MDSISDEMRKKESLPFNPFNLQWNSSGVSVENFSLKANERGSVETTRTVALSCEGHKETQKNIEILRTP